MIHGFHHAVGHQTEEQGIDVLQVVSEPQLSKSNACLNFRALAILRESWPRPPFTHACLRYPLI